MSEFMCIFSLSLLYYNFICYSIYFSHANIVINLSYRHGNYKIIEI